MSKRLTSRAFQDDFSCPINIALFGGSDVGKGKKVTCDNYYTTYEEQNQDLTKFMSIRVRYHIAIK